MSFSKDKIRIGVLRGGPSHAYDVSLKTGGVILANIDDGYEPIDIFISKDGLWHTQGIEKSPYQILKTIDLVVNGLHGNYGEDGQVQRMLDHFSKPYTGSDFMSSAISMNKILSKEIFKKNKIKTPEYIVIEKNQYGGIELKKIKKDDYRESENKEDIETQINESLPFPLVVKPHNSGSSFGVSIVKRPSDINEAIKKAFTYSNKVLIEEFIEGKEVSCGVIKNFRDQNLYSLLPVSINKENEIFDFNNKHNEKSFVNTDQNILNNLEKLQIQEIAKEIHKEIGLGDYSKTDFIIHPKRGIFVLETNSLPNLSHKSEFIKSLESVGGTIKEFLSNIISKKNTPRV